MNKNIIAMAIAAGLALPVTAIAGATVGGHMQLELNQPDLKDNATTNADDLKLSDNARGRLRIKGDEDLGNGLKAIYLAEWRINTDQGGAERNDGNANREAYVGLKGGFGTFYAGNSASPYKGIGGTDFDPYTATVLESRGNGGALKEEGTMTAAYGQNSFLANSLNYKKNFGPVGLHVQYHLNENTKGSGKPTPATTKKQDDTFGIGARIKAGAGITVIAAFIQESGNKNENSVGGKKGGTRSKVGLMWKGGAHKVFARYEAQADDVADNDVTALFAAYHLTLGKNVITIQYGDMDGKQDVDDKSYQMLAFKHNLSKKTATWVGYRNTDFKSANTSDNSVISAGLRIKF